eukprot:3907688-Amphidinium_carterae.1
MDLTLYDGSLSKLVPRPPVQRKLFLKKPNSWSPIPCATRLPARCAFGAPKNHAVDPVASTQFSAEATPSSDAAEKYSPSSGSSSRSSTAYLLFSYYELPVLFGGLGESPHAQLIFSPTTHVHAKVGDPTVISSPLEPR